MHARACAIRIISSSNSNSISSNTKRTIQLVSETSYRDKSMIFTSAIYKRKCHRITMYWLPLCTIHQHVQLLLVSATMCHHSAQVLAELQLDAFDLS
jgi:hypothetical protein